MAEKDPLVAASASGAVSHWRRPSGLGDEDIPAALLAARANVDALTEDADDLTSAVAGFHPPEVKAPLRGGKGWRRAGMPRSRS